MVELGEQPMMGEQMELEVVEKNLLSQDLDFFKIPLCLFIVTK